jgi:hypothetical protein
VLVFLAEEVSAEADKTPFYIVAGALVAFAVILGFFGIARHERFPASKGLARGLMLVCLVLVAGTMVTAVTTA